MSFLITFGLAKAIANFVAGDLAGRIGRKRILIAGWLFGLPGLILVYTYFQIPLMVIVFLPALAMAGTASDCMVPFTTLPKFCATMIMSSVSGSMPLFSMAFSEASTAMSDVFMLSDA